MLWDGLWNFLREVGSFQGLYFIGRVLAAVHSAAGFGKSRKTFINVPKVVDQPRFAGPSKIVLGARSAKLPPCRPNFARCPNDFAL